MIPGSVQIAERDDITKKRNKNMSVKIITNHQKIRSRVTSKNAVNIKPFALKVNRTQYTG
jgi:hypothetical protein